jgi:hypothetical protein
MTREELDECYTRNEKYLRAFASAKLGDPQVVEAVVQGARVQLLGHQEDLRGRQPEGVIWSVVCKKIRDALQKPPRPEKLPASALSALRRLRAAPPVEKRGDTIYVSLGGKAWPLELIRQTLAADEPLLQDLYRRGVPLDWIEYPPQLDPERGELPALEHALRREAEGARKTAEELARFWKTRGDAPQPSEGSDWAQVVEAVRRTLGGTSQTIQGVMPSDLRRRGEAVFSLHNTDSGLFGSWSAQAASVDIRTVVESEAQLVGNLSFVEAAQLADSVCAKLRQGENIIPGFTAARSADNRIELRWRRVSLTRPTT